MADTSARHASDTLRKQTLDITARHRRRWMGGLVLTACGVRGATEALAADLPALTAQVKRSIVAVGSFQRLRSPPFLLAGTGFGIGAGDLIATCAHVLPVIDPANPATLVVAVPGTETTRIIQARIHLINREADLAVLQVESPIVPALPILASGLPAEGSEIVLMGFPIGSALGIIPAVHRGLVAAIAPMNLPGGNASQLSSRSISRLRGNQIDILQLDATAYPGNSGSPVIDAASGRVVGVLNMGLAKSARESLLSSPSGISYAVPSQYLQELLSTK